MILRLEVVAADPSLRGGTIKAWHKSENEAIGFGEEVCTVAFDDFIALRRTARATLLAGRKRKSLKSALEPRQGKVLLEVILTAAETGTLSKILRESGERFSTGDTLALVSTADSNGESVDDDWSDSPPMRVVANMSTDPE